MKKTRVGLIVMLLLLLLVGCRNVEQPPLAESPVLPLLTQQAPEILLQPVPGRDPFSPGVPAVRQKESGKVDGTGRDPFLPAPAVTEPAEPAPTVPEEESEPVLPPIPEEESLPEGLIIMLQTIDRSWLDVLVDGRQVLRSNVASQQTLRWEAKREIVLQQVGREHAVRLTVNGQDFGLLAHFVQRLEAGEELGRQAGMLISLERRHPGGVLVGLRFLLQPVSNRE